MAESESWSLYAQNPSHVLPIVFACLIGISLLIHIVQNTRYAFWRITFFMVYGGLIFMTGWILRTASSYYLRNIGLYIAQIVLVLAGPPIYAAAEYNILGRLMHYLPMHATLNPSRVFFFFLYLGVTVETLTGTGAGQIAGAEPGERRYLIGGVLLSVSLLLQGIIEILFTAMVGLIHYRASKAGNLAPNVRTICIMLYCTSFLIFFRCIFRAVENFQQYVNNCGSYHCGTIANNEWYLYVFESAPMVIYTYYLNIVHPGRFLPVEHQRYLDLDGVTERMGPGWIDKRSKWKTFVDPFDIKAARHGRDPAAKFWERPSEWPVCEDGSFALGTASNRGKKNRLAKFPTKKDKKNSETEDAGQLA